MPVRVATFPFNGNVDTVRIDVGAPVKGGADVLLDIVGRCRRLEAIRLEMCVIPAAWRAMRSAASRWYDHVTVPYLASGA